MEKIIMNTKNIRSYLLLFMYIVPALNTVLANAYFYQAAPWTKHKQTTPSTKRKQNIIFLRDRHALPNNQKKQYLHHVQTQRKDLLDFLESTESMTIVEDLDVYTLELADKLDTFLDDPISYNPNGNLGFSLDDLLPKLKTIATPLIGFTQCCHALDIPVANVDFRFFFLDSLEDDLTTKHAYDLCMKTLAEIESYDDTPELNAIYEQKLSQIKQPFSSYKIFYHDLITKKLPVENINKLIDLKILHQIHTNKQYDTIVVLAGGAHISRIEQILPQLGYRKKTPIYAKKGITEEALNLKQFFRPFLA